MDTTATMGDQPVKPTKSLAETLQQIVRSPGFLPGVAVTAGLALVFKVLLIVVKDLYKDEYYSHGYLVPFIIGYIVYRWWPRISQIPVKPGYLALVPLTFFLFFVYRCSLVEFQIGLSLGFMAVILCGIWFAAGARWMAALTLPTLYTGFGLPLWSMAIDNYTNPLQIYSTKVAFLILKLIGMDPYLQSSNVISLNTFTLDVGVPCSGLKLVLAVSAFTAFFCLIGGLNWWRNFLMVFAILPLCLFINGLRIALIGVVGEKYGSDAGHQFHDYSGYITLVICFLILFKFARILGWKD